MNAIELAELGYLKQKLASYGIHPTCAGKMWQWLKTIYYLSGYKYALATVKGWGGEL